MNTAQQIKREPDQPHQKRKLSSDSGCRFARWNRVLSWGAVTLIVLVPPIVEALRRDPSNPGIAILAGIVVLVLLWVSWVSGQSVVDEVFLDSDHLSVKTGGKSFRIELSSIGAVDEPYMRPLTSSMAHPPIVRVRMREHTSLGRQFFFVPDTYREREALQDWFDARN